MYHTVEEVARILKVNPATVYRHIWKGLLSSHRIGTAHRISDEQLQSYLLKQSGAGQPATGQLASR